MSDQMTPDELRAAAEKMTSPLDNDDRVGVATDDRDWWAALNIARDAARRLADVLEYLESESRREGARWAGRRTFARDALNRVYGDFHTFDSARGDTTNHENRSENDAG